jgi:hypothetical protein
MERALVKAASRLEQTCPNPHPDAAQTPSAYAWLRPSWEDFVKIAFAILMVGTLCLHSLKANAEEAPQELAAEVNAAEAGGLALFKADQQGAKPNEKDIASARSKISDFCENTYKPVLVSQRGEKAIFFLAQPPRPDIVVFGRHYKLVGQKVMVSTKGCVGSGIPSPSATAVGAFITHLISPAPTEFHVFLSLKHNTSIFVGTSAGIWAVDKGKVRFLRKQK